MKHITLLCLFVFTFTFGQNEPIGKDGVSTIIKLFKEKPIVALGETHGQQELYDFLTKLINHQGFYTQVNDILIESGNALYQATLDDYISGKEVNYNELQKVWMNTTQSPVDPWSVSVYYNFLKTIRNLNKRIPKQRQIRVIAADPPIEWSNIHSREDYETARGSRDEFYATTTINEVLSKNRKALLINGGAHFGNHSPKRTKVNQRIEKVYPNSVAVILANSGLWKGNEDKEAKLNWQKGTICKVKDTWIGLLPGPRRMMMAAPSNTSSSTTPTTIRRTPASPSKYKRQDYFDYLLYLGSANSRTYGEIDTSIYQSEKLWEELNRRSLIRFNHKLIEATRKTGELRPEAYN